MKEKAYWIAFSFFEGIGPIRFKQLLTHFNSAEKAWKASKKELSEIGASQNLIDKFFQFKSAVNPEKDFALKNNLFLIKPDFFSDLTKRITDPKRKAALKWVLKYQRYKTAQSGPIAVITQKDRQYPVGLGNIPASPPVIYAKGNLGLLKTLSIAVVGTRKISSYGRTATEKLTNQLASAGLTIVSGMAYGVDSVAHKTALNLKAKTVAVLGCGVDRVYPLENLKLYQQIAQSGLIISEFPPNTPPLPGNFPARNRIISGISTAVLVVEAAQKSGALITAKCTAEQGKEVFAVPGPITSEVSAGTSWLIKQGAKLVSSANDIFEELNLSPNCVDKKTIKKETLGTLSKKERAVFKAIFDSALTIDDIIAETKINPAEVGSLLTIMKIKGIVKELDSGEWAPAI